MLFHYSCCSQVMVQIRKWGHGRAAIIGNDRSLTRVVLHCKSGIDESWGFKQDNIIPLLIAGMSQQKEGTRKLSNVLNWRRHVKNGSLCLFHIIWVQYLLALFHIWVARTFPHCCVCNVSKKHSFVSRHKQLWFSMGNLKTKRFFVGNIKTKHLLWVTP